MVVYEVIAQVRADLCDSYERYLTEQHIPEVIAAGRFTGASLSRAAPGLYQVRYEARDRESLDAYLSGYAPRLRDDLVQHFPAGVELRRNEWTELRRW